MRTILLASCIAILLAACIGDSQPANPVTPSETAGNQPNNEQQGKAFSISTEVYYQGNLDTTSTSGKVIGLSLTPQGKAEMITYHLDKSPSIVDTGKWTTLDNGNLLLNLRRVKEKDSTKLEFKTDGDKLVYTGTEYGADGLTLWVKPLPESK